MLAGSYVFDMFAISWLLTTGRYNPFAYVGVFFLALYVALYSSLAAYITRRWFAPLPPLAQYFAFAALWLLFEWWRTLGRLAMPFTLIAHAWAPWPKAIQTAEFFGEVGVSLNILLLGAMLLGFARLAVIPLRKAGGEVSPRWLAVFDDPNATVNKAALSAGNLFAIAFGMLVFSGFRLADWNARLAAAKPEEKLRVAAVQPAITQDVKLASYLSDDPELRGRLQEEIATLQETMIARDTPPGLDLLVMPESTFPAIDFDLDTALHERIGRMIAPTGADLLFGAVRIEVEADGTLGRAWNTAYFIPAGASFSPARHQDKMRLVPFGEYLPYFDLIPGFQEGIVGIASFTEGAEVGIFETKGRKHGALICFESTFGGQARKLAQNGAEFLSVITNDAWYRRSAGPRQHHDLSILRAVETRRPIIRAANTGISSIIEPTGKLAATLPLMDRGIVSGEITPQDELTFYTRWGNLWVVLSCLAALAMAGARAARARRKLAGPQAG